MVVLPLIQTTPAIVGGGGGGGGGGRGGKTRGWHYHPTGGFDRPLTPHLGAWSRFAMG